MAKFVNPFVDMAFKRIFGREESKRLMIDFLNAVIGDKASPYLSADAPGRQNRG